MPVKFTFLVISACLLGCDDKERSSQFDEVNGKPSQRVTKIHKDPRESNHVDLLNDYLSAPDASSRNRILESLELFLDSLTEEELSQIVKERSSSQEANDIIYVWRALTSLFQKNPKLSLDLFAKTNGLPGGAGISFWEFSIKSNKDAVTSWLASADFVKSRQIVEPLMKALGRSDPESAILLINQQTDSNLLPVMVRLLFADFSGGLEKSFQLVGKLPEGLRNDAFLAIALRNSRKAPKDAIEALGKVDGGPLLETNAAYKLVFENLFKQDPAFALETMGNLNSSNLQSVLSVKTSLSKAIETNPDAVILLMDKIVMTSANGEIFKSASFALAQSDPAKAFNWVVGFPHSAIGKEMLSTTVKIWGEQNPLDAASAIESLPSDQKNSALIGLAQGWSVKSVESFQESVLWSDSLSEEEKVCFLDAGLKNFSVYYPKQAADIISGQLSKSFDDAKSNSIVDVITQNLAQRNLEETIDWVSDVPARLQPGAVKGLLSAWVNVDPVKASSWLSSMPASAARDAGARVLADHIEQADPDSARRWRNTIGDK